MLHQIRKSLEKRDEGFTLIELLVVIIIIGILAAVAIPVFLNQRRKAWDSAAKSDVKNMTTSQETYFTDEDKYTATVTDLAAVGFSESDKVKHSACVTSSGTNHPGYVVLAKHDDSDNYWYIDSSTGQLADSTALPAAGTLICDPPAPS